MKYNLSDELYSDVRQALQFGAQQTIHQERENFLRDLPLSLRMELSMTLHRQVFNKYTLFTDIGDRYYITWVSSHLTPSIMLVGQNIYHEEEEIDGFYFMIRGLAAWTLPKMSNMIYSIVDPGRETISKERGRRMKIFQYFGMEDSIMNHLKLLQATKKKKSNTLLKHGEDLLKKR